MNTMHAMMRLQESGVVNGPLCVGLDTDPSYLPGSVIKQLGSPSAAVLAYNKAILERIKGSAACCKVQIAYYEALGTAGLSVYAKTLAAVKAAGMPVIADVKRGDIAASASAYARAHFSGDFEADIITVNPYMGFDTLEPFTAYGYPDHGAKGLFVLLRTSNPGMCDIEKLPLAQGGTVVDVVGRELNRLADIFAGVYSGQTCSPVGAVVGCTEESDARSLRDTYPDLFFLIPGYGAQGGAARVAAVLLDKAGGVVNSSRGILTAWKKDERLVRCAQEETITIEQIADAAAAAAIEAKQDLLCVKKQLEH